MTLGSNWFHTHLQRTKSADAIELEVETLTRQSNFLNLRRSRQNALPVFHRKDIQLGHVLGQGNFAEVLEVTGISPKGTPPSTTSCTILRPDSTASTSSSVASHEEQTQRQLVQEAASQRCYAIKHLKRKDKHDCKKFVKVSIDLAMEARYLASFDHPNIIRARGVSTSWAINGTTSFLLMDRLSETLDKRILRWKQDIDMTSGKSRRSSRLLEITSYANQMAQAVEYVHSHRIILRDLKPENIGFNNNSSGFSKEVKLLDFGMCRELPPIACHGTGDDECFLMSMAGSLRYMAPEVVLSGCYGLKADVFSLSLIMYEMITLEKPFGSLCNTPSTHKRFVCQEGARPTFPTNGVSTILPKELRGLIERAWSQGVADRPSMANVCDKLDSLINTDQEEPTMTQKKKISRTSSPPVPMPKSSLATPRVTETATCA